MIVISLWFSRRIKFYSSKTEIKKKNDKTGQSAAAVLPV